MISKSWSTSKKRAALYRQAGPLAEFCLQLFPLIVAHSDDYGRFDGDPETVKQKCDPGSPRSIEEFEQGLRQFEDVGLIQRYLVGGQTWLQIERFDEHQPGLLSKRTEPKSPAPPPVTESAGNSGLTKLNLTKPNLTEPKQSVCAEASSAPAPLPRGLFEAREQPRTQGPSETRDPAFLVFPVIGPCSTYELSEAQVAEWAVAYAGVDVRGEARRALVWLRANPGRRKTAKGMPRFLLSWLGRSADRPGRQPSVSVARTAPEYSGWNCPHTPACPHRAACAVVSARTKAS